MKPGAYIEDKEGRRFDVNGDYLFDPKMSTYVLVPAGSVLKVISPTPIKAVYIVADKLIMVNYNGWDYGAKLVGSAITELKTYKVELDGSSNEISILSFDKSEDVKIFYVTFEEIKIISDISTLPQTETRTILRTAHITRPSKQEISDINKTFYHYALQKVRIFGPENFDPDLIPKRVVTFLGEKTFFFLIENALFMHAYGSQYVEWLSDASSFVIDDIDNDGFKEIYMSRPEMLHARVLGGPISGDAIGVIYEKDPSLQPQGIEVANLPDYDYIFLLGTGDIDNDNNNELIVYGYNNLDHQEVGYIKFNKSRYEYHKLVDDVYVYNGGQPDMLIIDYDGDGVNELYIAGRKSLLKIYNDRGVWKVGVIVYDFGAFYDSSIPTIRMVLYKDKLYVKTAFHLFVIKPSFEIDKKLIFDGVGLRIFNFAGKQYLATSVLEDLDSPISGLKVFDIDTGDIYILPMSIIYDPECLDFDGDENDEIFYVAPEDNKVSIYYAKLISVTYNGEGLDKKYIPKGSKAVVSFYNVGEGSEKTYTVLPDPGYIFKIKYFRLITPLNVSANIELLTETGSTMLLSEWQGPNNDIIYDASDWEDEGFFNLTGFILHAKTVGDVFSADVILEYGGIQKFVGNIIRPITIPGG